MSQNEAVFLGGKRGQIALLENKNKANKRGKNKANPRCLSGKKKSPFFCSFAISYSLSVLLFFFLSLVFFLSVKISSFSTSSSPKGFVPPCFIVDVLCFFGFILLLLLLLPHLSAIFLSSFMLFYFSKNSGFQKAHHRNQNPHLRKFRWAPETLSYSRFRRTGRRGRIFENAHSRGRETGPFWTPIGKAGALQKPKNLKIHYV